MEWHERGSRNRNKERLQQNPLSYITTGHRGDGWSIPVFNVQMLGGGINKICKYVRNQWVANDRDVERLL